MPNDNELFVHELLDLREHSSILTNGMTLLRSEIDSLSAAANCTVRTFCTLRVVCFVRCLLFVCAALLFCTSLYFMYEIL